MVVDDNLRELIAKDAGLSSLREAAAANGLRTLREAGKRLVTAGRTTRAEAERMVEGSS
jgi:general secretion pathway protein E